MNNSKVLLLAVLFTLPTTGVWADFSYGNFSDTTGLTINGQGHVVNVDGSDRMRLVDTGAIYGGGSMFYNDAQQISEFHTSFCFRINELGGITDSLNPDSGADGLAFVIQKDYGPTFIEHTGGGQGYEGAEDTLAIEFDCWDNGSAYNEPSRSHVGVMVDGIIDHSYALATADWGDMDMGTPDELDSNRYWWADIDYADGILTVVLGTPPNNWTQIISVPVDIAAITGSDTAWVGLTAGTGLAYANHDITSWNFTGIPEPATLALLSLGGLALVRRKK